MLIGTTGMSAAEEIFLGIVANNVIHHTLPGVCNPLICSDLSAITYPHFYQTVDKTKISEKSKVS
jgi:hypothetical protein